VANVVFNIARGSLAYFYYAVENSLVVTAAAGANGPAFTSAAGSKLVVVPIETTGIEADAALRDHKTLSALLAGTSNEQTTMGRKDLTDAELAAVPNFNSGSELLDLDIPDITWTAATGNAISALLVCFSPDAASADTAIVPLTKHDFVVTPDGSDIVAQINAAGFYRSS